MVNITGEEVKKIINTEQTSGTIFYPSIRLEQTNKIDKLGKKTLTKLEIYSNGSYTLIEYNKIYKIASSKYVLFESSGEDFAKGESLKIIQSYFYQN